MDFYGSVRLMCLVSSVVLIKENMKNILISLKNAPSSHNDELASSFVEKKFYVEDCLN